MKDERAAYHEAAVGVVYPDLHASRTGSDMQLFMTQHDYIHNPEQIRASLLHVVRETSCDAIVLDFSGNLTSPVREPVLIQLADGIRELCSRGACSRFTLLFSVTPGADSASCNVLHRFAEMDDTKQLAVVLLGGDGRCIRIDCHGIAEDAPLGERFVSVYRTHNSRPETMLERKCIERLGHFKFSENSSAVASCRWSSYWLMEDCVEELHELFSMWWEQWGKGITSVVFDCPNNPCLRQAVCAVTARHHVESERYRTLVDDDDDGTLRAFRSGTALLVLDYVQNGTRLTEVVSALRKRGVSLASTVVCAVNKVNSKKGLTELHGFRIHGFIQRAPHEEILDCVQCRLSVPHDIDEHETMYRIRSFDMLQMISEAGWQPEPEKEIPPNAPAYGLQPYFGRILETHGKWIAYKMLRLFDFLSLPTDVVLIHPDESDSSRLAHCLRHLSQGRRSLSSLRVPRRNGIDDVLDGKQDWGAVLDSECAAGTQWATDLRRARSEGAVIIDIYYSSGATSSALTQLCEHLSWPVSAVIVFVDFNPASDAGRRAVPARYSLYDWQAPRPQA